MYKNFIALFCAECIDACILTQISCSYSVFLEPTNILFYFSTVFFSQNLNNEAKIQTPRWLITNMLHSPSTFFSIFVAEVRGVFGIVILIQGKMVTDYSYLYSYFNRIFRRIFSSFSLRRSTCLFDDHTLVQLPSIM